MKTRKMVLTALFIALSFIGANIKITGSIAFDSMAGFLGALILGPVYGAVIGAAGHFLTAATSGFYLSLPVHLIVMVDMALTMYFFGLSYKIISRKFSGYTGVTLGIVVSTIIGVIINGPVSILMIMPILGKGIAAILPVLSLAALLNIAIAHAVYKLLPEKYKSWR